MSRVRWLPLVALLVVIPPVVGSPVARARADDAVLAQLHQTLAPLRADPRGDTSMHGAVPAFAPVKRQLRAWVENRLGAFVRDGDEIVLARELSGELFDADLLCEGPTGTLDDRCDRPGSYSARGFLGEIRLERMQQGRLLAVRTAVGIVCGFDESVYLYEWRNERWQPLLEVEEDSSGRQPYLPLTFDAVQASPAGRDGDADRLVLVIGHPPLCGAWQRVNYRLWRVSPRRMSYRLLLDRAEPAKLTKGPRHITGSIGRHEAVIEFGATSVDASVYDRLAIRTFRIDGAAVTQIDPVALSPRDFVEEWLSQAWDFGEGWTDPPARNALEKWHDRLHGDFRVGEFLGPTRRCSRAADIWQVGIRFGEIEKPTDAYFLVRWQPPYRFRMVSIANRSSRDCTAEDPEADERRTLFPAHGWR